MKNKKAQILSIFLSACMLGTSVPVGAADLSSEVFSADDITDLEASADTSADQPAEADETSDSDSTDTLEEPADDLVQSPNDFSSENSTDDSSTGTADDFSAGDEEAAFSDSGETDDFSAGDATQALAGILDNSLEAQMAKKRGTGTEADIPVSSSVSTTCTIYEGSNLESQNYTNWSAPVESYLTTSPDGLLMRVQSGAIDGKLLIEYYDSGYNLKKTMTLDLPLSEFGGFYETSDNYYILTGQNNTEQDDNKEVYRVSKYSKSWKALGSCGLFGANTTYPFDAGSARMTASGKYLFVRTCHEMYNGHQANVTFSVDTSGMSVIDSFTDVMNTDFGYVSHSFNQFIQIDNGTLLGSDHGDAYPRAITVLKYQSDISNGFFVPHSTWGSNNDSCKEFDLVSFSGSTGNNYTGASQGGFEYSDSSYLVAGNYDADDNSRNVFVASVSKSGGTPVVRYFSDYAGTADSATTPHLVKTGSNSFVLLWSSQGYVYYTAIDGTGQQAGSTYKMAGNLSDCVPSIINGKLIWYAWKNSHNTFYEINLSDLSSNHATRIENGHKYTYGTTISNNQVDKTCRVCGISSKAAVPVKISSYIKSSDSNYYYTLNNSYFLTKGLTYTVDWSTWFSSDSGTDYLSDCTISSSDSSVLTVQQSSNHVAVITPKKSGKATLTIKSKYNPSAVFTSKLYVDLLSEDVFTFSDGYVGSYDGTKKDPEVSIYRSGLTLTKDVDYKVTYQGDRVNAGTFSITFTGIGKYSGSVTRKYTIQKASIYSTSTTCTLSPKTCTYDGKAAKPKVVITDNGKTLVLNKDYTVEYQNNTSPGWARAGITGIGNYSGYFTTSFYINSGNISDCDISLSSTPALYDGTEKEPPVTVKCNGTTLKKNQDYYLYYYNNVSIGTASVMISGTGNFSGSVTKTFQIKACDLSKCTVQLSASSFTYDGTAKKPGITVKNGSKQLVSGTDYTLSYKNNTNAGTASVTITGKGKYAGTITKNFSITRANFAKAAVTLSATSFTWNGTAKKPAVTAKVNGRLLTAGTDYTVSYKNNTNVGTASVTLTAKGNYTGSVSKSFSIKAASLTNATVTLSSSSFTYNGSAKKPGVTVKLGSKQLTSNKDYTISYKNNVNAGTASVTITGKGSYAGTKTASFRINPLSIGNYSAVLSQASFNYDGADKRPGMTVSSESKNLTLNTDYFLSYKNNTNAGTASVTATGKGNYTGSITRSFQIKASDFKKCTAQLSTFSFTYNGSAKKPGITVKNGSKQLISGTDYTVSYKNNINAGTASVSLTGKGNYAGTITKTFSIIPASFAKAAVTLSATSFTWNGTAKKTAVTAKLNDKLLTVGKDYTVSYKNNTNVGIASVTLTAKGNYTGSVSKSFSIKAASLTNATITLSSSAFTYNGSAKKPGIIVKVGSKQLTADKDYTISYKNNVNAGTASVTVTGKGGYAGTKTASFQIKRAKATLTTTAAALTLTQSAKTTAVIKAQKTDGSISLKSSDSKIVKISGTSIIPLSPGCATVTITAAQGKNYNAASQKVTVTVRPLPVSSLSLSSSAKGQITASWKQVNSITSYQIQYSLESTMKNAQTITAKSASKSAVLKKLTSGKKYYVRIRTIKAVSNKNYYSTWSKTASVNVK